MRAATVPTQIDWHQALNAVERIVQNADEYDKERFTPMDVQRLSSVIKQLMTSLHGRVGSDATELLFSLMPPLMSINSIQELKDSLKNSNGRYATFFGRRIGYVD